MDTGELIQDLETILIYLVDARYNLRSGKSKHMMAYRQCTTVQD